MVVPLSGYEKIVRKMSQDVTRQVKKDGVLGVEGFQVLSALMNDLSEAEQAADYGSDEYKEIIGLMGYIAEKHLRWEL